MKKMNICVAALLALASIANAADNPYAGQEKRAIKALSEQEISDYLHGRGMGTSKAAELNHYPGPRHVLDMADKLGLTAAQIEQSQALYDAMANDATRIGKEIVQTETQLEALYANRHATADNTRQLVGELAKLQAEFRLAHLNAHLGMQQILSAQQVALYDRLRGYDGGNTQSTPHGQHQHTD